MRPFALLARFSLLTAALFSLGIPATAQTAAASSIVRTFPGPASGVQAGRTFDFVGDLDGDQIPDLVVGYPEDDSGGIDAGKIMVLSGADGSLLWEELGLSAGDRYGWTIGAAGDVNADGTPDFMVATPWRRDERGGGWIYSGADFSLNIAYRGLRIGDRFGEALCVIGDFDSDGSSDTLFSSPGWDTTFGFNRGANYVYTGHNGDTIFELWPTSGITGDGIRLGSSLSWVGDVNNDGVDDFFLGTSETNATTGFYGVACIMSGADGTVLRPVPGSNDGAGTITIQGLSIAGAGDVNADEHNDFLVTSQTTGQNSFTTLYSGLDGSVIRTYPPALDATTIARVQNMGDVDGDGIFDHAIAGLVADGLVIFSGADGSELQTLVWPTAGAGFALDFRAAGDLDGDGRSDIAVGIPFDDTFGPDAGSIVVYSSNPCGAAQNYCTPGLHSQGLSGQIATVGSSSVLRGDLQLRASDLPTNKFGIFFYGPNAIEVPFGDGFRCIGGQTFRLTPAINTGPSGLAMRALDITNPPHPNAQISAGSSWNFQFWYRDPGGPLGSGFNLTDAVTISFCE